MKILFFIESLRSGGKERRLVELIKGLKKYSDIEMELVLTREDIHYIDIFETDIKIHIIDRIIKKDPRLFFKFYKIAKKFNPDIINVWGNMVAIYAIPTKLVLNIPMINNQITDAPKNINIGVLNHKITFPFSDLIIANSNAGLKAYNAPIKKSLVIYNGFDMSRISNLQSKKSIRDKFNIKTPYVVAMVASFSDKKDYSTYIEAAIKVLENRKDVTFLCVGSGDGLPYKEFIPIEMINNIKFLGRQENVESIMNITDIGVLSTYTEGISNAIMEFMALGKPVIATDGGGTKEIVIEDITGHLISIKDVERLYFFIDKLLSNTEELTMLGKKAKQRIIEKFNIETMIDTYIENYKTLIKIEK